MKISLTLISLALALGVTDAYAQISGLSDKQKQVIEAVMNVYEEELVKNPDDYAVLYSRANQYFVMNEYQKALDDVNHALKVTTRNDKEMLTDEYVLRAKIYNVLGNKDAELIDLQEAYRLNPQSEQIRFSLAESYYSNEDYDAAEKLFLQLYHANNLNYSATAVLAKVEVKKRNYGKAIEYANQAVKLYPAEAAVYINRADVLIMMGQFEPAAQDLISALSVSGDTGVALKRLTTLADTNYDAVVSALGNSISKAPNVGMFYYIRSSIEIKHEHFAEALNDLEAIIKNRLYDYHSIYYDAARCAYQLGNFEVALSYINNAIASHPSEEYYSLRSKINTALGNVKQDKK